MVLQVALDDKVLLELVAPLDPLADQVRTCCLVILLSNLLSVDEAIQDQLY